MRLAFVMERQNYYRLLGPVIDRALARGWEVDCWQPADEPQKGSSALERRVAAPAYRHGRPRQCEYRSGPDLAHHLASSNPDVLVALRPPPGIRPDGRTRWLALQYTLELGALVDARGYTPFDAIGLHTAHWRTRAADSLRILAYNRARTRGSAPEPVDDNAVDATMRQRGVVVGFPEMDQFHTVDAAAVRRQLDLDPARPTVVYCPFPFLSNPRTFWVKHVYGAGPLHQSVAVWLPRGRRYRKHVEQGWDDRGVVRAVRAFCDANGAAFVVKARAKDPVPTYLSAVADRVLYDRTDYPATVLELMSIAALCVHFFSTVAYEAAYAGVPSVCITAEGDDLGFPPVWREWLFSTATGSSFSFAGVIYPLSVGEMVDEFARRRLADFRLEPSARAQYLEKFVGIDDGNASDRFLDLAAALVQPSEGGGRA